MNDKLKIFAYGFIALRLISDIVLAVILYFPHRTLVGSIGYLLICSVFHLFLFFGIIRDKFVGRYGQEVSIYSEPIAYWFVVGWLTVSHLALTIFVVRMFSLY